MKREQWSQEDFLNEIPVVPGSSITAQKVLNYGVSNYVYHVMEQGEEEYLAYLQLVEAAGYKKHMENTEGIKGHFYSTTYLKEDVVLTITFLKTAKRLSVSGCLTLYRDNKSAEEVFENVPVLDGETEHRGDGTYVITTKDVEKETYLAYQKRLLETGFLKYAENEEGLGGTVFTSTFVRDSQVITICYMKKLGIIYTSGSIDLPLSEHLKCKETDMTDLAKDAKTKIHMMELWHFGNSFVFQLKNGHFIVNDGGCEFEIPYLLDYLEQLVPEGEKPVIEAWLITHMHRDHCGLINSIAEEPEKFANRMIVEGFYYSEPNDNIIGIAPGCLSNIIYLKRAAEFCRTSKGEPTKIYRPQTGQRYYFCGLTMDIVLSQEHLEQSMFAEDLNDSSTWCMYTIEGQKCLFVGDAERGGMRKVMAAYDSEYLDLDLFTLPHHGFNTRNDFTDYTNVKTVLVTVRDKTPKRREEQNAYLRERVQEWILWGDGTKVFTFPYQVGTYETLQNFDWKYDKERPRPVQPNLE